MQRLILKHTGLIYLKENNPILPYFSQKVETRIKYSSRTILRSFRHRSILLRNAAKDIIIKHQNFDDIKSERNISDKDLKGAIEQFMTESNSFQIK
jgi:hypothetical protein